MLKVPRKEERKKEKGKRSKKKGKKGREEGKEMRKNGVLYWDKGTKVLDLLPGRSNIFFQFLEFFLIAEQLKYFCKFFAFYEHATLRKFATYEKFEKGVNHK